MRELADLFYRQAHRRVDRVFTGLWPTMTTPASTVSEVYGSWAAARADAFRGT